ncbi:GNAT family N-acetyltransferase [Caulobacter sp. KR2-114]|uniref:GNAT family N-acetyltransferase n=1 Tax=Caulobacter sp. KR2-114 TaxID=3400912 RepID=UPI003C00E2FB
MSLVRATDAHFAWMLGEAGPPDPSLALPPGGVDEAFVLRWLRRNLAAGARSWLVAEAGEVVGLCSHKAPPDPAGRVEIGYATAPERRRAGHATAAIALLVGEARADPGLTVLTAETAAANQPSQRVLQASGFVADGRGWDDDEGEMLKWRLDVAR